MSKATSATMIDELEAVVGALAHEVDGLHDGHVTLPTLPAFDATALDSAAGDVVAGLERLATAATTGTHDLGHAHAGHEQAGQALQHALADALGAAEAHGTAVDALSHLATAGRGFGDGHRADLEGLLQTLDGGRDLHQALAEAGHAATALVGDVGRRLEARGDVFAHAVEHALGDVVRHIEHQAITDVERALQRVAKEAIASFATEIAEQAATMAVGAEVTVVLAPILPELVAAHKLLELVNHALDGHHD